jgi:DNA-binding beta-propeller fold protein YncE
MTSDGRNVYIAMMGDKSIGQLNLETASLTYIPLSGKPVQTGVSADGKYALATVFDTRSVAVYNIPQKQLNYIDLPKEAKGPLQLYPTPEQSTPLLPTRVITSGNRMEIKSIRLTYNN